MISLQNNSLFTRKWFRDYSFIFIGTFFISIGYVFFMSPYKIVPGGIYGISIVLHHTFGFPLGLTALCFNIPLTITGIKLLGPRFGAKTIVGFVLTSVYVDTLYYIFGNDPLKLGDDVLLASIFGGVIIGIGVGIMFKSKATSGGTDVVAMILCKYTRRQLGQLMMIVDSCIVLIGLAVFGDWKIPLYSWITIFTMGKVIDIVLQGINYDKALLIISDKHEQIRRKIIDDLNRGGTYINGTGLFNGKDRKIIYTVVNRRELAILEEFISEIDDNAFLTVLDASEILGKGFKSLKDKISD